jgi:hypothetical protein
VLLTFIPIAFLPRKRMPKAETGEGQGLETPVMIH